MNNTTTPATQAKQQRSLDSAANLAKESMFLAVETGQRDLKKNCTEIVRLLVDAGAASPFETKGKQTGDRGDLAELAAMDTPEARALMEGLKALLPLAEAVDARRGNVLDHDVPLLPGESRGTDLAETISELVLRLKREVFGTKGRE